MAANQTLADRAKTAKTDDDQAAETAKVERLLSETRRKLESSRARERTLASEVTALTQVVDIVRRVEAETGSRPEWMQPSKLKAGHRATAVAMLSDLHLDEVVRPEEMRGRNAYNRDIATMRMQQWATSTVKLLRDYLSGVRYDGGVLMLGGDTFSGSIHDELKETNADTLFGGLLYWLDHAAGAVDVLASYLGRLHVVAVPGNHGRQTRKPRAKLNARDNLDWLFAHLLARQFSGDERVTWQIPEGRTAWFPVYGRGHLLAHGDGTSGGRGIGGIWPPIKRYRARLAEIANGTDESFDTLWLGHFHQYTTTPSLRVNGSMKGWDEYALSEAFAYEPPQQDLAIVTPEHGITWQAPVFCSNPKKEGWA